MKYDIGNYIGNYNVDDLCVSLPEIQPQLSELRHRFRNLM